MAIININDVDYLTEDDGSTHLNLYSRANTELGRWASNFEHTPIELADGNFASLESYYHWLKIRTSMAAAQYSEAQLPFSVKMALVELERSYGKRAQTLGRNIKQELTSLGVRIINLPTPEFDTAFETALQKKLETRPDMLAKLQSYMEDGIPLVHYYLMNGTPYYRKRFDWLSDRFYAIL